MAKISIYLNSKASNHSGINWEKRLSEALFRSELNFFYPQTLVELYEFLERDEKNGTEIVVSVGGDGTVNTLIQSLVGKDMALLVLPGGTANDLANELKYKKKSMDIARLIRDRESKRIDIIKVNDRYMATNGGLGIGGHVVEKINLLRSKFSAIKNLMGKSGRIIYPFMASSEFLQKDYITYELYVECDQFQGTITTPCLMVNNQNKLGQTFSVAPHTRNDDGKFNVTLFTHPDRVRFSMALIKLSQGVIPTNDKNFISFETTKIKITNLSKRKVNFFGDGEVFEGEDNDQVFDICIVPCALEVFCPTRTDEDRTLEVELL